MIEVVPLRRSHQWSARLELRGAPVTPFPYGSGALRPEWVEVSYRAIDGNPLRLEVVRLHGIEDHSGQRTLQDWFSRSKLPAWLVPIVDRYRPDTDPHNPVSTAVDTAASVH